MDRAENMTIRIEIDQELAPIIPEYLENRRVDCRLVEQWLTDENRAGIKLLAHRMIGSGGSYGFDEISEIGESLEYAALVCDDDGIRITIERLRSYLSRVTVVYI
ncbi:MAG: Hpt domain-containing protein [Geobacteraceae bacterium]|nr:Hpt domain-containing protein [Geobacteraceae bacterium]